MWTQKKDLLVKIARPRVRLAAPCLFYAGFNERVFLLPASTRFLSAAGDEDVDAERFCSAELEETLQSRGQTLMMMCSYTLAELRSLET